MLPITLLPLGTAGAVSLMEPPHLLLEALDPLLLFGKAAADVLEAILELLVRLRELLMHLPHLLATTCRTLKLLTEPPGHLLDMAMEIPGMLFEAPVEIVGTRAARARARARAGTGLRRLVETGPTKHLRATGHPEPTKHIRAKGLPVLGRRYRTARHRPPRLRPGASHRRLAMWHGTPETGLNRIELAEDQLELLGDMGMRIRMRAQTSPEIQQIAVDLEGDRTMLAARPAKSPRRCDFDSLRDAIRADLNRKRSDLRRHARSAHARQTMGHWRRTRRYLKLWTGLAALSALRLGLSDACSTPPEPLAALRHSSERRLRASCIRWTVIERTAPPGPRAVSFGTGPIASAVTTAVRPLSVVLLPARMIAVCIIRLLEKCHERPYRLISTTIRAGRERGISGGRRHRDAKEERCREEGDSAATKRTMHDDNSF
ncbi:MAG: hypothetical protein RLZZ326_94 [Planctomycetota bacterium]